MVNHRCVSQSESCWAECNSRAYQGSTSGFGKRLTLTTLARGDRVIATGRDKEKLEQLVSSVNSELVHNVRTVQLDVTEDESEIKAKIDLAAGFWGCIDVLVNNAGALIF
jgi:NADP-dependent 3-hydroxy acid dehydrogenase YdfG